MKLIYLRPLMLAVCATGLTLFSAHSASATAFSFVGNFTQDDNIQSFSFTTSGSTNVRLISYSYGGGTNAAGTVIPRGGFDPILALFDSSGALVGQDDDAISGTPGACGPGVVTPDALTGLQWDTCLDLPLLAAGTYTVTIQEYDNFAIGPNLSNGFIRSGTGNFTDTGATTGTNFTCADDPSNLLPFHDVSGVSPGCLRDSHWAFDILNVTQAHEIVPEPITLSLFSAGLAGSVALRRRRKKAA